jgi:hypothetical protein
MNLGANDKTNDKSKIFGMEPRVGRIALAALALATGYMVYSNLFSGPSNRTTPQAASNGRAAAPNAQADAGRSGTQATGTSAPGVPAQAVAPEVRRVNPSARPKGEEFHPALRSRRKEDQVDVFNLDPTLRLELLAKVQDVKPDGGQRNLFQFGAIQPAVLTGPDTVIRPALNYGPFPKPPDPLPVVAVTVPPPPIPYKYYGLSTKRVDGKKTAFFLDGEEIILAPEGYVIKKRYRVVRIGATSVLMEDVDSKHQQSLPYIEDASVNAPG